MPECYEVGRNKPAFCTGAEISQTQFRHHSSPEVAANPNGKVPPQGDQPDRKVGISEHDYATAAETFTLSRSATDTSNDGGSNKCWCLHFVQVTASVIL